MSRSNEGNEIEAMDKLFRDADFAAENEGLEERLRERISGRLAWARVRPYASTESDEERELGNDELSGLVAAGTGADATAAQMAMRKILEQ